MKDEPVSDETTEEAAPEPTPAPQKGGRERRKAPRARGDFRVTVHGSESDRSRIKDLSTNGLCCYHPAPIEEMQLVQISLEIPGVPPPPEGQHQVRGAVVRCDPRDDGEDGYEVAIYFTEISGLTRLAIDHYVQAHPAA